MQLTERLLETSLFQGVSKDDLKLIVGHTKFDFTRFAAGKVVVKEGDRCEKLYFLLQGTLEITNVASDHSYSVSEVVKAPFQLQPERLFGIHQHYFYTVKAHSDCSFMMLSKEEIVNLLDIFLVCRINYLNLISSCLQRSEEALWYSKAMTLYERIVLFLKQHCIRPAGQKHVQIKMVRLAEILGVSRLEVSVELNRMKQQGLLTISRGHIYIPSFEQLLKSV